MKYLLRKNEMSRNPRIAAHKYHRANFIERLRSNHFKMRSIISRQLVAISSEAAASQLFNERVKYYDQQYNYSTAIIQHT